jgi:hypothetical protein
MNLVLPDARLMRVYPVIRPKRGLVPNGAQEERLHH